MAFHRTVLVGGSDLGGRRGDREFSALRWLSAALWPGGVGGWEMETKMRNNE